MKWSELNGLERSSIGAFVAADQLLIGEWVVVVGANSARRANAIYPIGDPGLARPGAIAAATEFLAAHDRPALVKLAAPIGQKHDLEPYLIDSGFRQEGLTDVLIADPSAYRSKVSDVSVTVDDVMAGAWLSERSRMLSMSGPQVDSFASSVVPSTRPTAFATALGSGSSQGRAVIVDGWVGIFDMLTDSTARRRGLGRAVLGSLLAWGVSHGADQAFLQVEHANEPARQLYLGVGFELAYRYEYWRASESSRLS